MTDWEYARTYWEFADEQENELQSYLYSLDISDIITQVFNRFAGVDLNRMLSTKEVEALRRKIDRWLDGGLNERGFRLILRDIQGRKKIREREALSIWLLAAFSSYYQSVQNKAAPLFAAIARDSYRQIFQETRKVTGKGKEEMPTQADIDTLMQRINPSMGRTLTSQLWIEAQYHRDTLLGRFTSAAPDGGHFDPESAENKRKFQSIEDKLLSPSKPTKTEPQGHHGLLDKQMTFIVGHTVLKALKDAGAEKYRFIAVIDEVTTHACRSLNGKIFAVKDAELGVNLPPISVDGDGRPIPHPCRSIIRVYTDAEQYIRRANMRGQANQPHHFDRIGEIDITDENAVQSLLEAFKRKYMTSKTEHCLVIAKNGEVFLVYGDKASVNTTLLGDKMDGSINIHNHPAASTQYSFSYDADLPSFYEDGSSLMLAYDEKYTYEIRRPARMPTREAFDRALSEAKNERWSTLAALGVSEEDTPYNEAHVIIMRACQSLGIPYRRWENE